MRNLPPLIELRAFEAVARHLSFGRAASELGVTPTAISHQIRMLERFCGVAFSGAGRGRSHSQKPGRNCIR
jgi:LysR family transcriptional regulator, glycine cleavage system transcriptional activator